MTYWITFLFNSVEINRDNLGFNFLSAALNVTIAVLAQLNYSHHEEIIMDGRLAEGHHTENITIMVFLWTSAVFYSVELIIN